MNHSFGRMRAAVTQLYLRHSARKHLNQLRNNNKFGSEQQGFTPTLEKGTALKQSRNSNCSARRLGNILMCVGLNFLQSDLWKIIEIYIYGKDFLPNTRSM
jgi:hypothetical protein